MSTRSGPYKVEFDGTWLWEHDMYQRHLLDEEIEGGDTIRIYAPYGLAIEVSFKSFDLAEDIIPRKVTEAIKGSHSWLRYKRENQ